jgi:hypothetical protein
MDIFGFDKETVKEVTLAWVWLMMKTNIITEYHQMIGEKGIGDWWETKAVMTGAYLSLYETETLMEGTAWINPMIENPDNGTICGAIKEQKQTLR